MFKLIKLAAFGAAGYFAYDLYQRYGRSYLEQHGYSFGGAGDVQRREFERDLQKDDEGRMGVLTGGGRGTTQSTSEPSGMSTSHTVGRGVR
jgi:hypothetical protein